MGHGISRKVILATWSLYYSAIHDPSTIVLHCYNNSENLFSLANLLVGDVKLYKTQYRIQ